MSADREDLHRVLEDSFQRLETVTSRHRPQLRAREIGVVTQVGRGVAVVEGLESAQADELLRFPGGLLGLAFNLDEQEIGCVLLDQSAGLRTGAEARRTGRVLDVPVGEELLGRVIDPVGRPVDGKGPVDAPQRMPCERTAPAIMDRAPVTVPMQTGWKVIDALVPVGRGQRELILGDRQTGKTTIAVDTILNQDQGDVICVYCAVGQRSTSVARVVDDLRAHDAMEHCVVVVGEANSTPGQLFVAPFAATTIGEYFMERGHDVLIVYDDLTAHARAYRELSLLLRRPPGREAFPGDIFYLHSRLLERSTHLRDEAGGGSLTALPIIETEAQNVSAYIPTNLISITDGQIYLAPHLFHKGLLPAVDVGRSVSRVGGKTQLPAYRTVAGDLRLAYSQFEELEKFARFSSQLDDATRTTLERGRRVREVFKQARHEPLSVPEQVAVLVAVTLGVFDELPLERIADAKIAVRRVMTARLPELCQRIVQGESLSAGELESIRLATEQAVQELT